MLIEEVVESARGLLGENAILLSELVASRKRFENWMQIEIYRRLIRHISGEYIELERPYPGIAERCDMWRREADGSESWVELKLCVTNYVSKYLPPSYARPITNQIGEIISDASKLKRLPVSFHRNIFLLVYPMVQEHDTHAAWCAHLSRLEASGINPKKVLVQHVARSSMSAAVVGYQIAV
jgi:hypothetical protein